VSKKHRGKLAAARQAHFRRAALKGAAKCRAGAQPFTGSEVTRLAAAEAVYERAREAGEANPDAAFPLYCEAFQRFYDLYNDHPQGLSGDTCLGRIRTIGWTLWRVDRRRFSLSSAIDITRELVRRHPRSAREWSNLSEFLMNAGRWTEALSAAQVGCARGDSYAPVWSTLGRCYFALGRISEGEEACQTAAQLTGSTYRPYGDLLLLGHYGEGWRSVDRWNAELMASKPERLPPTKRPLLGHPRWRGGPTTGQLLLHCEDGYGDALMMARWIARVRERVGTLRLRVKPGLVPLFSGQWPGVEVISRDDDCGQFDLYGLTYDLPAIFGVEHPEDVRAGPYLKALRPFRRLPGAFRVGIRWAGSPSHIDDLNRSTALEDWRPVLQVPGVTFYSLQLDDDFDRRTGLGIEVTDLSSDLTSWDLTAAAMMELDLIISVDTSCAHLAGALGRPLWILTPACPDWRWMLRRTDTPWYPSARLFRQPRAGDWGGVLERVAAELRNIVPS
jgi:tetratricopeptide (TPR) repeat protein